MGTTPGSDLYDLYRETRLIDDSIDVLRNDVMYTSWLNGQKLSLLGTWTPCTYKRYCNAHNGYNQACILPKEANMRTAYPSPFIKGLKNVVLAGQWISPPGGIPGSCITGKFAAYRVDYLEHKAWRIAKKIFWRSVVPTAFVLALMWLL